MHLLHAPPERGRGLAEETNAQRKPRENCLWNKRSGRWRSETHSRVAGPLPFISILLTFLSGTYCARLAPFPGAEQPAAAPGRCAAEVGAAGVGTP